MVSQGQLARLAKEWDRLMNECNASRGEARMEAFAQIVTAYSEPHRHYHNLDHIASMLAELRLLGQAVKNELPTLELATWFHDVVYDTRSSENENRSAEIAKKCLRHLGVSGEIRARVCKLIRMTKNHAAPNKDRAARLFLDADLSILAVAPELYARYSQAIRKEYAWVPDREYYEGRRMVLDGFLRRLRIFSADRNDFTQDWQARENLCVEIAQINEMLSTLPS